MFKIVQILMPSSRLLVYAEMPKRNQIYRKSVDDGAPSILEASGEGNTVNFIENFNPNRRDTHPDDIPRVLKKVSREIRAAHPKLANDIDHLMRVAGGYCDPDIQVGRRSRISIITDGISPDEKIVNAFFVQQFQELFEVLRKLLRAHMPPPYSFGWPGGARGGNGSANRINRNHGEAKPRRKLCDQPSSEKSTAYFFYIQVRFRIRYARHTAKGWPAPFQAAGCARRARCRRRP